jgi:tetratricopeptide (TPR) repeat protein
MPAEAVKDLRTATLYDPHNLDAGLDLGKQLQMLGDDDGTIAEYTRLIGVGAESAAVYYNRGTILGRKGEHQRAIDSMLLCHSLG